MIQKRLLSAKKTLLFHGPLRALMCIFYFLINKIMFFRVIRGVVLTSSDIRGSDRELPGYDYRFAAKDELMEAFREMPARNSSPKEALYRGDECYAAFHNNRPVSYGWYSRSPNPVNDRLTLYFNNRYVYMYDGYTIEEYRGQGLHGTCMLKAFEHYKNQGQEGLISYVDAFNFSSLSSCKKLGYQIFGSVFIVRICSQYIVYHTDGCSDHGFFIRVRDRVRDQAEIFVSSKNKAL